MINRLTIPFQSLKVSSYLKTPFLISSLLSSCIMLSFLVLYFSLQPEVPIFYSLAQESDYLAPKIFLVLFPMISFLITFFHLLISKSLINYERVILQIFAWSTVFMQILLCVAYFRILLIIW